MATQAMKALAPYAASAAMSALSAYSRRGKQRGRKPRRARRRQRSFRPGASKQMYNPYGPINSRSAPSTSAGITSRRNLIIRRTQPASYGAVVSNNPLDFSGNTLLNVKTRKELVQVSLKNGDHYWYYDLNPGIDGSFPWLAQIANRFDKYRINSFKIIYIPSCATSTHGTITCVFNPDPNEEVSSLYAEELRKFQYAKTANIHVQWE